MTTTSRKKSRLRLGLFGAAALGCSSATLSGTLVVLAMQQPVATTPTIDTTTLA